MPDTSTTGTNSIVYTIVFILFALSMIAERIANLWKLYEPKLRLKKRLAADEKVRERKIMWRTLVCGWLVSLLSGADLFQLLKNGTLINIFSATGPEIARSLFGIFLTGIFVSLGSKFWHDMLDIVLQFANLKKFQADQVGQVSMQQANILADEERTRLINKTENIVPALKKNAGYAGYDIEGDIATPHSVVLKYTQQPNKDTMTFLQNYFGDDKLRIDILTSKSGLLKK
jgi:hypothetical protein